MSDMFSVLSLLHTDFLLKGVNVVVFFDSSYYFEENNFNKLQRVTSHLISLSVCV